MYCTIPHLLLGVSPLPSFTPRLSHVFFVPKGIWGKFTAREIEITRFVGPKPQLAQMCSPFVSQWNCAIRGWFCRLKTHKKRWACLNKNMEIWCFSGKWPLFGQGNVILGWGRSPFICWWKKSCKDILSFTRFLYIPGVFSWIWKVYLVKSIKHDLSWRISNPKCLRTIWHAAEVQWDTKNIPVTSHYTDWSFRIIRISILDCYHPKQAG